MSAPLVGRRPPHEEVEGYDEDCCPDCVGPTLGRGLDFGLHFWASCSGSGSEVGSRFRFRVLVAVHHHELGHVQNDYDLLLDRFVHDPRFY